MIVDSNSIGSLAYLLDRFILRLLAAHRHLVEHIDDPVVQHPLVIRLWTLPERRPGPQVPIADHLRSSSRRLRHLESVLLPSDSRPRTPPAEHAEQVAPLAKYLTQNASMMVDGARIRALDGLSPSRVHPTCNRSDTARLSRMSGHLRNITATRGSRLVTLARGEYVGVRHIWDNWGVRAIANGPAPMPTTPG